MSLNLRAIGSMLITRLIATRCRRGPFKVSFRIKRSMKVFQHIKMGLARTILWATPLGDLRIRICFDVIFWTVSDGSGKAVGAQKRTRTSTSKRTLRPERSASTNSAIWARKRNAAYTGENMPASTDKDGRSVFSCRRFARPRISRRDRRDKSPIAALVLD